MIVPWRLIEPTVSGHVRCDLSLPIILSGSIPLTERLGSQADGDIDCLLSRLLVWC